MAEKDPLQATDKLHDSVWSRPDDRFIPIRARDLARRLAEVAPQFGLSRREVELFATALEQVIDRETGAFERGLADAYARFNPDRDTRPIDDEDLADADYATICGQLSVLLDKANYEELNDVEIARAVLKAGKRNLAVRVDPSRIEFLRVWVRGRGEEVKIQRRRWRPWQTQAYQVSVFRRLVFVARLKDQAHVILKLFKDIPEADVEALLPHAEVTMSLWDRIKLLSTGAGTLGVTATKLLKIAIGFAALWKLAWILLLGMGTLAVRSILGYRNARMSRDWQRTRHLYFQNLGNNASALQLLVAKVKQEEFKEVLLAYLLAQHTPKGGEQPSLCDRVEQFLREQFDVEVDFDIADAEHKLDALGLRSDARVLPIRDAIASLEQRGRDGTQTVPLIVG